MIDEKKYEAMVMMFSKAMTESIAPLDCGPARLLEASLKFSPARKAQVANTIWVMIDAGVELQMLLGSDEQTRKYFEEWRDQLWHMVKDMNDEAMKPDDINIEIAAGFCAAAHLKDGWNLQPRAYRLAHFPGDEFSLRAAVRRVPTGLDVVCFEREMWRLLAEKRDGA